MENQDKDVLIGIGIVLVLVIICGGIPFGTYKIGRYLERRDLTKALIIEIKTAYYEGKDDGIKEGYSKGWEAALRTCDDEPLAFGRY